MLKFLLLLIFIVISCFLLVTSLLKSIFSFFFGKSPKPTSTYTSRKYKNTNSEPAKTQKKFGADEGEYVPYEEIKD